MINRPHEGEKPAAAAAAARAPAPADVGEPDHAQEALEIVISPGKHRVVRVVGFVLLVGSTVLVGVTAALKIAHYVHGMPEPASHAVLQTLGYLPASVVGACGAIMPLWFSRVRARRPALTFPFTPFAFYLIAACWSLLLVQAALLVCMPCSLAVLAGGGGMATFVLLANMLRCWCGKRNVQRYTAVPMEQGDDAETVHVPFPRGGALNEIATPA